VTGPEHYLEAERLLGAVEKTPDQYGEAAQYCRQELAAAQVHATLALAAATARPAVREYWGSEDGDRDPRAWAEVAS
jgi:hypothetical protein